MPTARRYHTNALDLALPNMSTFATLQSAITKSLEAINIDTNRDDSIYTGASGIVLMYLRLHLQSPALSPAPPAMQLRGRIPINPRPSRVSPLHSEHGPDTIALLHCLTTKRVPPEDLFLPLQDALSASASTEAVAYEVLYGTAGLLASLIALGRLGASHPVASTSNIRSLANSVLEAGRAGASEYAAIHGTGLPLMWAWHGKYYLGAIHGVAGVLTILLQLPSEVRDPMLDTILPAAYALLGQVDVHGHLPSSLPRHQRSSRELVQLCHGAPGALLLIAAIKSACPGQSLPPDVDIIETRLSDRIWEEGLLRKGISLCHGAVGNAWPWLLLTQLHSEEEKRGLYLGRALAFLLHATELPPIGHSKGYRTPDTPYSLFEGLAGAVCAWSEACVILSNRLQSNIGEEGEKSARVLGLPWLGGLGCCGI